jgi:hypothetical protein
MLVRIAASVLHVPPDRLPHLSSLTPVPGSYASYALVGEGDPWLAALRKERGVRHASPRVSVFSGQKAHVQSLRQYGRIGWVPGERGETTPVVDPGPPVGDRIEVRPVLAQEAGPLVLWFRHEHSALREGEGLVLQIHPNGEPCDDLEGRPADIPAVVETHVEGTFVMRRGEALVLFQKDPESRDALVTVVRWGLQAGT